MAEALFLQDSEGIVLVLSMFVKFFVGLCCRYVFLQNSCVAALPP